MKGSVEPDEYYHIYSYKSEELYEYYYEYYYEDLCEY